MSRYVAAYAVTHAKSLRDHLRRAGQGAEVVAHLYRGGAPVRGTRTYIGTQAFGLRLPDGASRALRYAEVEWVEASLKNT